MFSFFSDELRVHLKNAPKAIMAQQRPRASDSDSDSSDDSSSEGLWEIFLSSEVFSEAAWRSGLALDNIG